MSSFVHPRSFTVFPAIYVLPAANFANESAAILIRKTPPAFKMTLVDNRAADARFASRAQDRMRFDHVRESPNRVGSAAGRHRRGGPFPDEMRPSKGTLIRSPHQYGSGVVGMCSDHGCGPHGAAVSSLTSCVMTSGRNFEAKPSTKSLLAKTPAQCLRRSASECVISLRGCPPICPSIRI
jgi:hypothetical protein